MCMCPLCANFIYFSSSFCFREQSLPGSAMCPSLVLPRVFFLFVHGLTPCFITCRLLVQPHVLSWFCHVSFPYWPHVCFLFFHVSCPGFDKCRLHEWPHVFSWFCHISFPYLSTCHFHVGPHVIFRFTHVAFLCLHTRSLYGRPRGIYPRVSSRFVHVTVSSWTMFSFLVLPNVRFGRPRVRILDGTHVHILHVD